MKRYTKQGVRDLDGDFRASDWAPPPKSNYVLTPDMRDVRDLIYSTDIEEFHQQYPKAKLEPIWDEIHETRYKVEIDTMDVNEYLEFLIRHGRLDSFMLQTLLYTETKRIGAILDKVKASEQTR